MDRISDEERRRIAELLAEGGPVWRLHQEINRSRYAIRRAVVALHRRAKREPRRSPLRLSAAEREEISRGLAAGEPVRAIARLAGRRPPITLREMRVLIGRFGSVAVAGCQARVLSLCQLPARQQKTRVTVNPLGAAFAARVTATAAPASCGATSPAAAP
jgi:hypothetical protein